jgi:NAD(P)-dependent dehydrogenase (short-subunit alcohol dehydrogenase family)
MSNVVAVTGAASGIGRGSALRLARDGWTVIAIDRAADGLDALKRDCDAAASRIRTVTADVASADGISAAFADIAAREGVLNGLVASAGVLRTGPLSTMPVEDFDDVFAVNVRGLWLTAKHAMPLLEVAGRNGDLARAVFLASIAGFRHKVESGAYAATKAAVIALTKVWAVEAAAAGVLINAVAPATVDTPMVRPFMTAGANTRYKTSGTSPLGRIAEPDDVASVIAFLLSPESRYVTGAVIPVDGGTSAAFVPPGR